MNEAIFWQIVDSAKGRGGDNAHASRLRKRLSVLRPEDIASFDALFRDLRNRAATQDLWAAGLLLNGGHASDDGFEYFRNWLISRGSATFDRALLEPDSLADEVIAVHERGPSAEFESYGYAAVEAYRAITQEELVHEQSPSLTSQSPDADGLQYTPEVLSERLPKLWQKYGQYKLRFDEMIGKATEELMAKDGEKIDVPGFGAVQIGAFITHRRYGIGTIKKLTRRPPFIALISFTDGDHPMMLTRNELLSLP